MCAEPRPLIVVVEDEEELSKLIILHLEEAGMNVQHYNRCAPALRFLQHNFANLLLLDINLPDGSGFELLRQLKDQDINTPTIFLTANTHDEDKVKGLNMGGDDYITKPFSYTEVVARIRAVLRRTEGKTDYNVTKNVRTRSSFSARRFIRNAWRLSFPTAPFSRPAARSSGSSPICIPMWAS